MGQNNYRERITQLNFSYFTILKEIAQSGDGLTTNLLGLDRQLLLQLASTETYVLERLAAVGVPLFRVVQPAHLSRSIRLVEAGQDQRAQALMTAGAIASLGGKQHG
jgi:hypothetical protein